MSAITVTDIYGVLDSYKSRYKWLDVFVDDVPELANAEAITLLPVGTNHYRVMHGNRQLELKVYPKRSVARFSLAPALEFTPAVVGGAVLGALVGVAARPKGPEGLILGLLLGGLAGAAADQAAKPDENSIMTLRFDEETAAWRVYHGPYLQWAKEALRPG